MVTPQAQVLREVFGPAECHGLISPVKHSVGLLNHLTGAHHGSGISVFSLCFYWSRDQQAHHFGHASLMWGCHDYLSTRKTPHCQRRITCAPHAKRRSSACQPQVWRADNANGARNGAYSGASCRTSSKARLKAPPPCSCTGRQSSLMRSRDCIREDC